MNEFRNGSSAFTIDQKDSISVSHVANHKIHIGTELPCQNFDKSTLPEPRLFAMMAASFVEALEAKRHKRGSRD